MNGELIALAAAIEAANGDLPSFMAKLIQHAPESFDDQRAGQIAATVRDLRHSGEPVSFEIIGKKHLLSLNFIIGELVPAALPMDEGEFHGKKCWQSYQVRRAKAICADAMKSVGAAPENAPAIITATCSALEAVAGEAAGLIEQLESRIYSPTDKPEEPSTRYILAGISICTPGNLTTVSSQAKAGKSAAIGAMMASTFAAQGADCLGFASENPDGLAVMHIDTEQCLYDHWQGINRAIQRALVDQAPPWLRSYCLTGFSADEIRAAIPLLMKKAAKDFGGIHSVLIDGNGDVVQDVNDPAETCGLVTELHKLAIKFNCPIINIIHVNPGSDFKTRGHLGSQLERKSETNLRLEKDGDGITVMWADKNRRAPIPKKTAPRFGWSDDAGMHMSTTDLRTQKGAAEKLKRVAEAQAVFTAAAEPVLNHGNFVEVLGREANVSGSTAKRRVKKMVEDGIICKDPVGRYMLSS